MKDSRKNLLQMIYDHEQIEGTPLQITADGSDTCSNARVLQNDILYLKSNDYIVESMPISRFYVLMLTEKGEQFVENGFKMQPEFSTSNIFNIENAVTCPAKREKTLKYALQTVKNRPSGLPFSQNTLNLSKNKSKVFNAS